jgi:hypothetical protein
MAAMVAAIESEQIKPCQRVADLSSMRLQISERT